MKKITFVIFISLLLVGCGGKDVRDNSIEEQTLEQETDRITPLEERPQDMLDLNYVNLTNEYRKLIKLASSIKKHEIDRNSEEAKSAIAELSPVIKNFIEEGRGLFGEIILDDANSLYFEILNRMNKSVDSLENTIVNDSSESWIEFNQLQVELNELVLKYGDLRSNK